jgi:formate/nitrite transporter FocA (FNT family)
VWKRCRVSHDGSKLFPGKYFISTALEALDAKTAMTGSIAERYLQRAAMAGIIIGIFYGAFYNVVAAFDGVHSGDLTLHTLGKLAGALVFGWALVFIYYSKSELLTSNMMIVCIGAYHRQVGWGRSARLLGLCYLGNALGGLLVAILMKFSTLASGPVLDEMHASVATKLAYISSGPSGWTDLFVRAILCNLMINIAMLLVYNGFIKDDLTKALAMVMAVFIFAFLSFEHSVANTVLFTIIGLKDGIDVGLALGNVVIALLGNFVGGGLLIGVYYAYVNDDKKFRTSADTTA